MAVISVRMKNIRKFKDFFFQMDGKSSMLIGDSGECKTTLMEIIKATMMQSDITKDYITDGEENAFYEVVHDWDGIKYTVSRPLATKNGAAVKTRFTVVDEKGGRHTLETLLENIFGKAFINKHFDYNEFFFECKSPEARANYMIEACGDITVVENLKAIPKKRKERGLLGTRRKDLQILVENSPIPQDESSLAKEIEHYIEPMTMDKANEDRRLLLDTRPKVVQLTSALSIVKDANDTFERSKEVLKEVEITISNLEEALKLANEKRDKIAVWQKDNPADPEYQNELELKISNAEIVTKEIEDQAELKYQEALLEVNTFNKMRDAFNDGLDNLELFTETDKEWTKVDNEITAMINQNKEIFKKRLPIPGLILEEVEKVNKDGDTEIKNIIMYEGRELCFENVSKGRSIRLAIEIQKAINPGGNHIVMIPEAQSLGSQLDEILEECKKYNIQAIVEVTERKQEFHIEFEEQFIGDKVVKAKPVAKTKLKK